MLKTTEELKLGLKCRSQLGVLLSNTGCDVETAVKTTLIHSYIPLFLSFFVTVKLILEQKYGHATSASKGIQ